MSIESRSRQYGKVFDHWQIKEFLGSGSGGKTAVFRLVRSDSNRGVSALKVVNLIEVRGDLHTFSEFGRKEYETAREECSRSAEQEVWLMDDLRGNTNIVDYLDHTFVDWSDETGFGRDLLIRMEFLKDLRSELHRGRVFSETEVLKIGSDICIALIRCHRKNILHRDVKPENIFRNKDGDYKLGDFGVSRVLDACPGAVASTGIGTYEYWPAEQMTGRYDTRVDIYSLGLVLYELCNQNRLPFAASTYVTGREVSMRLMGTPLPEPIDASPALSEVILKACAFDPEERYQSAEDLFQALSRVNSRLQKTAEGKTEGFHASAVPKKTEYATLSADASDEKKTADPYGTMLANADAQRDRISIPEEPARKKAHTIKPAEKYVPRFAAQTAGSGKERKKPALWIAGALFGLCIVVFGAALLFMNGSNKQNPEKKDAILQSEAVFETATQSTTSPAETVLETEPRITTAVETTVAEIAPDLGYKDAKDVLIVDSHVVVLYKDGTVDVASKKMAWDASEVRSWKNIVEISADRFHIVGLKADGTVVATGSKINGTDKSGACDVKGWTDIVAVETGEGITVGLKSDGTVVYAAKDGYTRLGDVSKLKNVVDIDCGGYYMEYLLADGTWKQHNPDKGDVLYGVYPDMVKIFSNWTDSIGINADGTLVIPETNKSQAVKTVEHLKSVSRWTDIADIDGNVECMIGLKKDGTLLIAGKNNIAIHTGYMPDMAKVDINSNDMVRLHKDGTIYFTGNAAGYTDMAFLNKDEGWSNGRKGTISRGVTSRSGPGTEYSQKTNLQAGTVIVHRIVEEDSRGALWCYTMFGWIPMEYVIPE